MIEPLTPHEQFAQAFIDSGCADWSVLLMFADWLMEHGEHGMAKAVRWMVENEKAPAELNYGWYWEYRNKGSKSSLPFPTISPGDHIFRWEGSTSGAWGFVFAVERLMLYATRAGVI